MRPTHIFLFMAIVGLIMTVVSQVLKKKRAGSAKYQAILEKFNEEVSAALEEGETVEAVCGYRPCAAVTDRRLLLSDKSGLVSIPYDQIRSVKGSDASARKTSNIGSIFFLEIKAARKWVLADEEAGFGKVVRALDRHVSIR